MTTQIEPGGPRWPRKGVRRTWPIGIVTLAMLVLAVPVALASDAFTDVPGSHLFHDEITAIKNAGITTGCTATTYCPDASVTRGQMAAFMTRGYGRVASNNVVAASLDNGSDGGYVTELSTSVTAGAKGAGSGFVLVQANLGAYTFTEANCPCQIEIRIRNATTGSVGPTSFVWVGGTADEDGIAMGAGAVSAVFTIPAGATHVYEFQAVVDDANGSISAYIDMWAEYLPFNGSGGSTAVAAEKAAAGVNPAE